MEIKKKDVCIGILFLFVLFGCIIYFIQGNKENASQSNLMVKMETSKQNDLVFRSYGESVIEIGENENIILDKMWNHVKNGDRVYLYCYETEETRELVTETKESVLENLQPGTYQIYAETENGEVKNLSVYGEVVCVLELEENEKIIPLE